MPDVRHVPYVLGAERSVPIPQVSSLLHGPATRRTTRRRSATSRLLRVACISHDQGGARQAFVTARVLFTFGRLFQAYLCRGSAEARLPRHPFLRAARPRLPARGLPSRNEPVPSLQLQHPHHRGCTGGAPLPPRAPLGATSPSHQRTSPTPAVPNPGMQRTRCARR